MFYGYYRLLYDLKKIMFLFLLYDFKGKNVYIFFVEVLDMEILCLSIDFNFKCCNNSFIDFSELNGIVINNKS